MDIFAKFDKEYNVENLKDEIKGASENKEMSYEDVPHGSYEVKVEKLELVASKSGKPMVSVWFRIVNDCKYKNSMIFMNQVIEQGFQIHIANELLRSLTDNVEVEFESYTDYADLLLDVFEETGNYEYALDYSQNKKGYNIFKITEKFALED